MAIKVGEVFKISDGNGGTLNAKVTAHSPSRIHYVARRGNRGSYAQLEHEVTRPKWRKLVKAAEDLAKLDLRTFAD